jgi:hypothetical protein
VNESSIKTENVFLFWRAIEALTPQDIDKENARDKLNPVYKVGAGSMLPGMTRNIPVRILRLAKCGATPLRRGLSSERDFQNAGG